MTKMTVNGVSTTTTPGQEQYEFYHSGFGRKRRKRCQYDYRDMDGELFSCVRDTLEECRKERDAWLQKREQMREQERQTQPTGI